MTWECERCRFQVDERWDECAYCEIAHMQKVIDRTAIQRLDLESENLRMIAEVSRLNELLNKGEDATEYVLATINKELRDEIEQLQKKLASEESDHLTTIDQRDRAEKAADKLANAISLFFNVDVGEHSNLNCPWEQAYDAIPESETTKGKCCPGRPAGHDGDCSAVPIRGESEQDTDQQ